MSDPYVLPDPNKDVDKNADKDNDDLLQQFVQQFVAKRWETGAEFTFDASSYTITKLKNDKSS